MTVKKYIVFVFLFFISFKSYSQMGIFQHINEIKEDDGIEGTLQKVDGKDSYIYYVNDSSTASIFFYALTIDLYCYMSIVKPLTSLSLQTWIQNLNKQWVIVDDDNWKYYRTDGIVITGVLTFDDEIPTFLFMIK